MSDGEGEELGGLISERSAGHPNAPFSRVGASVDRRSELERTVQYLERTLHVHRKQLVWIALSLVTAWLLLAVKEVTSLLLLAYVVALLMDPLIARCGRWGLSRSASVVLLSVAWIGSVIVFLAYAVPLIVQQYGELVAKLPLYLRQIAVSADEVSVKWTGVHLPVNPDELWGRISAYSSVLSVEHLRAVMGTLSDTLLSGYSVTLTILNLVLFPFFFYYIACDLPSLHATVMRFLPVGWRGQVRETGGEILVHLYAFVRGQLTVASILVLFYICGLLIIGLPSAVIIGFLAGVLSMVPYLGVATGLVLSVLVTLITDPGWWPLAKVGIVFAVVQTLEGSVLTPRIVGESLGLHPLLVMLSLVVASQLLGLLGLVIAIPAAATLRVLIRTLLRSIETGDEGSALIVRAE